MLSRIPGVAILAVLMFSIGPVDLCAADWRWPSQMSIAGFRIIQIKGTTRPDGSGTATGMLQIPRVQAQKISLTRSSKGDVTGQGTFVKARVLRTEVLGKFKLTKTGLKATAATLKTLPKPIAGASITVKSRGEFIGTGKLALGRTTLTVRFTISGTAFKVSGSTSVEGRQDTPLATYKFRGRLDLRGSSGTIIATAGGTVERTGKLADQVTTYTVSNTPVNLSNGQCMVNAGGVRVTFDLF